MVYDMLDKSQGGTDQVEYFIPLESSIFSALHSTVDLHNISAIWERFYADGREAELVPG